MYYILYVGPVVYGIIFYRHSIKWKVLREAPAQRVTCRGRCTCWMCRTTLRLAMLL